MVEHAIGDILCFLEGFHILARQQQKREWKRHGLEDATGKTVATVGLGAIGKEITERYKKMGMTVTGVATSVRPVEHVDVVCDPGGVEDILRGADFVVVCLPLTPGIRGFFAGGTP